MRTHTETGALVALSRKRVEAFSDKSIVLSAKTPQLGNKTWGKIDFLVNHCGYVVIGLSDYKRQFRTEAELAKEAALKRMAKQVTKDKKASEQLVEGSFIKKSKRK